MAISAASTCVRLQHTYACPAGVLAGPLDDEEDAEGSADDDDGPAASDVANEVEDEDDEDREDADDEDDEEDDEEEVIYPACCQTRSSVGVGVCRAVCDSDIMLQKQCLPGTRALTRP